MMQSRHIVRSVLCCLLCLTVCAVPALAGNEQYTDGLLYWQDKGPVITNQQQTFDFTKGYFPASISSGDADTITDSFRLFAIKGGTVSFAESTGSISWYLLNSYVEVLFPVPAPLTVTMANLITTVGTIITGLVSWAETVLGTITGNPLLLFLLLVFAVGGGVIGIVNRLIRG